jgi:hypothetical protein
MMNRTTTLFSAVITGILFLAKPVSAGYLNCGTHVIQDGQRGGPGKYEVSKKCGRPTEQFGNTWVYDFPGQTKKILRFNDGGQLISIDG